MSIDPLGLAATSAFGAPLVSQHQLAPHVVVAFGTPQVSQHQLARHVVVAFGTVSLTIPRGVAATVAFGTPIVVLNTSVASTSGSGLALARKRLDDLIEAWEKMQKRRREVEAEQERLSRAKTVAKRARSAPVVDLEAERRIDDAIVACNHAYIMLQEEADQVYAGARSVLAGFSYDIEAISTENRRALQRIETDYQEMLQADDEDVILALM